MELALNSNMCRCCASEGTFKDVKTAYHWMGEQEVYSDMLRDCFDITLCQPEEGDCGGICEVCITQLRNAFNFKKQVQLTEEQFKRRLEDKVFKSDIVKIEMGPDELNDSDDHNVSEDFSANEYEVPIKQESEDPKPKKRAAKASTSRAKKPKTEDGETTKRANGEVEVKLKKDLNFSTFIAIKPTAVKRKRKHAFERERISELDLQMDNLKTILRCSNATPIRSFKSSKFVCCYCHDEFPDPIYLKRHNIKSHVFDQERPDVLNIRSLSRYIVYLDITDLKCKICDEEIDNLKLLTKHITKEHNEFINQGLNNHILCFKFDIADVYKCVECNYIINDFTKLQLHMNKHYKNYLCEFCDEGFINRNMMVDHKQEVHNMQQKVKYRVKFVAKKQKKIH